MEIAKALDLVTGMTALIQAAAGAEHPDLGVGIAKMGHLEILSDPGAFKGHQPRGAELLRLRVQCVAVVTAAQPGDVVNIEINVQPVGLPFRQGYPDSVLGWVVASAPWRSR